MSTLVKSVVLSLVVAFSLCLSAQAVQETMPTEELAVSKIQVPSYDDATLEKFTTAMSAVSDVVDKYQAELSTDVTPEKVQEIQQAAQDEMVQEIEKTGLEVETYTQIAQHVQMDDTLRQRVISLAKASNEES